MPLFTAWTNRSNFSIQDRIKNSLGITTDNPWRTIRWTTPSQPECRLASASRTTERHQNREQWIQKAVHSQLDPCVRCSPFVGTTSGARAWFVDFPTINHDMNLSNTVKLLSRILFLQPIASNDKKYNKKESSKKCPRSAGRLPKVGLKGSRAISAAVRNFQRPVPVRND